ncbi:hypothetical protein Aduo_012048 [Ancylostoma duodenale]
MSLHFAKARVTKTKTSVENIVDSTKTTGEEATKYLKRRLTLMRVLRRFNMAKKNLEEAREELESAFDDLDGDSQREEEDSFNEYGAGATDEIIRIEELVGNLGEMGIGEFQTLQTQEEQREQQSHRRWRTSDQRQTSHPPLASLQVPSFSEKSLETGQFLAIASIQHPRSANLQRRKVRISPQGLVRGDLRSNRKILNIG